MDHVAVEIIRDGGRRDTVVVGGDATWGKLRDAFSQVDGLVVVGAAAEPSAETTLAALARQGVVIHAGPVRLEFGDGAAAMAALALAQPRPEIAAHALAALKEFKIPKDFLPPELPSHQPRFNARDFRRQARQRPPKIR